MKSRSEIKNSGIAICSQLALQVQISLGLHQSLYINIHEDIDAFAYFTKHADKIYKLNSTASFENINDTYELIIGNIALSRNSKSANVEPRKGTLRPGCIIALQAIKKLKQNGIGLFLIEPFFNTKEWQNFIELIASFDFHVNAYFDILKNPLAPITGTKPLLILLAKNYTDKIFIAEITEADEVNVIWRNYMDNRTSAILSQGIFIDRNNNFEGFSKFRISQQIDKLKTQYKEFQEYRLCDVSLAINRGKHNQSFTDTNNAIYIPVTCYGSIMTNLEKIKTKHQYFIQVILNNSIVKSEYAANFYSSELGKLILTSLVQGEILPIIGVNNLASSLIAIPNMREQEAIISAHQKLEKLKDSIISFTSELSLNPKHAYSIQDNVDKLLTTLDVLAEAEQILSLIRQGESKTLEFKQTMSVCIKSNQREKHIELMIIKTIVAFLNTSGGTLLIGVADDGNIKGVQDEIKAHFHANKDKYLLQLKNLVKDKIGEEFYPLIDYHFVKINENFILAVNIQASDRPCYCEGKDFYVRTNPATDKLDGPKMVEYIRRHFKY